jgi:WD40 repeat protein
LSLKFGMNDFFGLVRSFFEDRPTKPEYNRLTFSFLGVATPTDLIQSHNTSAFNIGYAVEMTGFTLAEAMPLMQGLANQVPNPQAYLEEAVRWSGGQPFLMQRLLDIMERELAEITSQNALPEDIGAWVANLVQERVVEAWESQDVPPHLVTIRDRVLSVEEKLQGRMLGCYQQVLADGELADDRSEEQAKLRLTGLVVRRGGKLVSYNPIYAAVFNNAWVEGRLADLRPEFYGSAFREWQGAAQKDGFLLRGEALQNAEEWAQGKRLSDMDERFLRESREFERKEIIEANQILKSAEQKANKRLNLSFKAVIVMTCLSIGIGTWTFIYVRDKTADLRELQTQKLKLEDQKITLLQSLEDTEIERARIKLEILESDAKVQLRDARENLRNSEVSERKKFKSRVLLAEARLEAIDTRSQLLNGQELDSLLTAVRAGHKFKSIDLADEVYGNEKTEISIALQAIVYKIRERQTLKGHSYSVNSVAFSPDGKTIATGSWDNTVKLWNLEGKEIKTLKGHSASVFSVAFSPDGKTIATGSGENTVKLWNLEGKEIKTLKGHSASVRSVAFSPDGKTIATGSWDNTVKLWNLEGKEIKTLKGHSASVRSVAFSPDGQTIASGSGDNTVKLWNLEGQELQTLKGHSSLVLSVAFSPSGKIIASGSGDNTVKLWNLEGQELQTLKGHSSLVLSVAFSPDGQTIASGSWDNTVKLWNLEGTEIQSLKRHSQGVFSVTFSPDGKTIASGSWDNTVKLWNLEGKEIQTLKGHSDRVIGVAFSPDGKTIATGSWDNTVKLWNLEGKEIQTLKGHSDSVISVAFSPDGKTIATGSDDTTIKLWNLEGKEIQILKEHSASVSSVAFSPDGKTVATGSWDNTVKLWNLEGKEIQTLKGHSANVFSVAFSPDGKTIATGSGDNTVKLWNLEGKEIQTLKGHSDRVNSVVFSPDGKTIASGSWDGTVKLWNLDLDDLIAKGCDWLRDYLTNNPNATDEDRQMCGIAPRKK